MVVPAAAMVVVVKMPPFVAAGAAAGVAAAVQRWVGVALNEPQEVALWPPPAMVTEPSLVVEGMDQMPPLHGCTLGSQ